MEKFLNVVRSNNMVQAVLCIAFGLFLMIYPSITVQGIIMLFGVALALMGAAGLLSYFRQRSVRYRDSGTLMAAAFYVIIAIIAFAFPKVIAGFFSIVLGVVLILLAIVNVVGSSIARAADYVLYTYAGPEIAVASTKAYMVQLCTLYLFAFRLAYARGRLSEAETRRLTAELLRAGEVIQPRLADCEQIKYLASRFVNTQSCFFIGRGFDYALSLEGSLKLKEISYVHSDAYAAGELKHGTISLITDGVPVIALATQKQVYEKTISNAKETKSRGARVILFTTKDVVVPEGVADYVVRLDDYDELLMPLQLIVPLQLFAYYMAVLRGCDVDKPRNLAKSVTVE